jgi:hypothetical protein
MRMNFARTGEKAATVSGPSGPRATGALHFLPSIDVWR